MYEPKVGDVIGYGDDGSGSPIRVVTEARGKRIVVTYLDGSEATGKSELSAYPATYVRPATPDERRVAGLPDAPPSSPPPPEVAS